MYVPPVYDQHPKPAYRLDMPELTRTITTDPNLDPVIEAYKHDVDRTLLRRNLERSVDERLRGLVALQAFYEELRSAGRKLRGERT